MVVDIHTYSLHVRGFGGGGKEGKFGFDGSNNNSNNNNDNDSSSNDSLLFLEIVLLEDGRKGKTVSLAVFRDSCAQ